jgi:hypothetical protein
MPSDATLSCALTGVEKQQSSRQAPCSSQLQPRAANQPRTTANTPATIGMPNNTFEHPRNAVDTTSALIGANAATRIEEREICSRA